MQLSAELTAVVGKDQLARDKVLKKVLDYIKENNLKDPNNGRQVMCDDKLKANGLSHTGRRRGVGGQTN
jgi:upstream activation factor subunit UAF30